MKLRTEEMLSDHLSADLSWRKKELTDVRHFIHLRSESVPRRKALMRCGVALLYAHFEGFTKQAGRAYLEYVAAQRLPIDKLERNLLAVILSEMLSGVSGSRKPSSYQQGVSLFLDAGASRAAIPYKTAIDTGSNLSSKVLREIAWILGLDYSFFETKEKLIDSHLLDRRNHIAHGEFLDLEDADYDELHDTVIEILDNLRNEIENAAALRKYVRTG